MKKTLEMDELAQLSVGELNEKVLQERIALVQMRVNSATMQVKDYSQYKKKRKTIARALSLLSNAFNHQ